MREKSKKKSAEKKTDKLINRDYRQLKITCLLGALLSPLTTGIWSNIYPDMRSELTISLLYSMIFILFLIITSLSGFIKKNAYSFMFALCYILSLSLVISAYIHGFPEAYTWILIFVILAVIMVLKRVSHILTYLAGVMGSTLLALNFLKDTDVTRYNTAAALFMFSLIALIFMKTKLDTQQDLNKSEQLYRDLVEISPFAILVTQDEKVILSNTSAASMAGVSDLAGSKVSDLIADYRLPDETGNAEGLKGDAVSEYQIILKNGKKLEVEVKTIEVAHNGKPALMIMFQDISARKRAEREISEAEFRYRSLVESALVGVYLYQDKKLTYVNPYIVSVLGYSLEEIQAIDVKQLVHPDDAVLFPSLSTLQTTGGNTYQFRMIKKGGNIIVVETQMSFLSHHGSVMLIGTLLDVTQLKEAEELATRMAYHDVLTGLPNRYMFNECTYSAIKDCMKNDSKLGIMFLDLDRFKTINDTMGHSFGDLVLQEASERLKSCIRKDDVVCRYGGDEFVIILKNAGRDESIPISNSIINAFGRPFSFNCVEVFSTTSIGLSFFPEDGDNVETLVKNADAAMYFAKLKGRNNYQFYSQSINEQIAKKIEFENGLRKALLNGEFKLHYQPQVDLKTGLIVGVEALIRWQHPVYGMVPPLDFIPLAEETGLINPIGEWVLETACQTCKAWQKKGLPSITVSVNVSGYQLEHSNFVMTVRNVLEKTELEPKYLVLEITESIMQDVNKTNVMVKELKALGVKVAIDDFGIGYSSLNVLKSLTIDILKIEPSFIYDAVTNPNTAILIKFIIDMGHQLKYEIVAEGIENQLQADLLRQSNCNLGQGYYFNKPLSCDTIETILKDSLLN